MAIQPFCPTPSPGAMFPMEMMTCPAGDFKQIGDASSRVFQDSNGKIFVVPKPPAEVLGELGAKGFWMWK